MKGIILQSVIEQDTVGNPSTVHRRSLSITENNYLVQGADTKLRNLIIEPTLVQTLTDSMDNGFIDGVHLVTAPNTPIGQEYMEYYVMGKTAIERKLGYDLESSLNLFHPKTDTSIYMKPDGTTLFDQGYLPTNPLQVVPKIYVDNMIDASLYIEPSDPKINRGTESHEDFAVVTKGQAETEPLLIKLPTFPQGPMTVWNNNGVVDYVPIPPRTWDRWAPANISAYENFAFLEMKSDGVLMIAPSYAVNNNFGTVYVFDENFNLVWQRDGTDVGDGRMWSGGYGIHGNLVLRSARVNDTLVVQVLDITDTIPDFFLAAPFEIRVGETQELTLNFYDDFRNIDEDHILCHYYEEDDVTWRGDRIYNRTVLYQRDGTFLREFIIPEEIDETKFYACSLWGNFVIIVARDAADQGSIWIFNKNGAFIIKINSSSLISVNDDFLVFSDTNTINLMNDSLNIIHSINIPPKNPEWQYPGRASQASTTFVYKNKLYMGGSSQDIGIYIFDLATNDGNGNYQYENIMDVFGYTNTNCCEINGRIFVGCGHVDFNGMEESGAILRDDIDRIF